MRSFPMSLGIFRTTWGLSRKVQLQRTRLEPRTASRWQRQWTDRITWHTTRRRLMYRLDTETTTSKPEGQRFLHMVFGSIRRASAPIIQTGYTCLHWIFLRHVRSEFRLLLTLGLLS